MPEQMWEYSIQVWNGTLEHLKELLAMPNPTEWELVALTEIVEDTTTSISPHRVAVLKRLQTRRVSRAALELLSAVETWLAV